MKAIVFAAGLGTRLGEFTREHPKALAEIGGVPLLGRVLTKLHDYGIEEIVVNVHHFADQIKAYLRDNANFGIPCLRVSHERELLLETGGGVLAALSLFDRAISEEPLLLHNVDILTDFPLREMETQHLRGRAEATLLVAQRKTQRYLLLQPRSLKMDAWVNTSTDKLRPEGYELHSYLLKRAFGGVHVVSPSLLDNLKAYNNHLRESGIEANSSGICRFSIMDFYIDMCSTNIIAGFEPAQRYRWIDVGKPDSLRKAEVLFARP